MSKPRVHWFVGNWPRRVQCGRDRLALSRCTPLKWLFESYLERGEGCRSCAHSLRPAAPGRDEGKERGDG
jgi:hypothetical protein